jgi:hypothetical protein
MGKVVYPKDHKPGLPVPKGGSSCANCHYMIEKEKGFYCGEPNFIRWNGGSKIPTTDPESYCSDWWQGSEDEDDG